MLKPSRISTKVIAAIALIWFPFVIVGVWYEMRNARELALQEVERWGVSSGESVRIALNTLMREGRMDARFAFFDDLSNEITELESIRVIRGPRVNEIFEEVRQKFDIPREEENLRYFHAEIDALQQRLEATGDTDERQDIQARITDLGYEIKRSEALLKEYSEPLTVDPRQVPRDALERQVLESGQTAFEVNKQWMRMVAPYQVRGIGCSGSTGCHYGAEVGTVLGAVDMVFSIENINRDVRSFTLNAVAAKVFISIVVLGLVYLSINMIVIRNLNGLRNMIQQISNGNLGARLALRRRRSDRERDLDPESGDEIDYLIHGFNSMAQKLQEDKDQLEQLATCDSLTGLYNRGKFTAALTREIAVRGSHGRPLSLLMIDLDHFKNINDAYGHQVGDEALRVAGKVIREHTRNDDIAARYGGEEIALILPATTTEEAAAIAERIRDTLAREDIDDGNDGVLQVTASIGVATIPGDAGTEDELLRAADGALYQAKEDGRNCVRRADTTSGSSGPTTA